MGPLFTINETSTEPITEAAITALYKRVWSLTEYKVGPKSLTHSLRATSITNLINKKQTYGNI